MRIHSIEIENITSLKGKHHIDFNGGLHGEELFAITGPTGAGKSSLLSAISLALYGKTYKASLSSNDFVTSGQSHAKVVLNFTLAGKSYQANWGIKVLKKNGELIKNPKPQRDLICEGVSLEQTSIADILGLDFDQFCKTIILNQGEFAKFLHSNFRERKDIIEKLYRTQELSQITKILKEKIKHEDSELRMRTISFDQALPYSDEEIKSIKGDLKDKLQFLDIHESLSKILEPSYECLHSLHTKLKEEKNYLSKEKASKDSLKNIITNWNSSKTKLSKNKSAYESVDAFNKNEVPKLREAIKHQTNLANSINQLGELSAENETKTIKVQTISNELRSKDIELKSLSTELKEITSSYVLTELFGKKTKNEIYSFKEDILKLKSHNQEESRVKSQELILLKQIKQQKDFLNKQNKSLKLFTTQGDISPTLIEPTLLEMRRKREANLTLWSKFEDNAKNYALDLNTKKQIEDSLFQSTHDKDALSSELKIENKYHEELLLTKAIIECHKSADETGSCPVCHSSDLSKAVLPTLPKSVEGHDLESLKIKINKLEFKIEDYQSKTIKVNQTLDKTLILLNKNKNIIFPDFGDELTWTTEQEVTQGLKILKELYLTNQKSDLSKQEELNTLKTKIDQITNELKSSKEILDNLNINHLEITEELKRISSLCLTFINNWKNIFGDIKDSEKIISSFESDNELFNNFIQKEQLQTSITESKNSLLKQHKEYTERLEAISKNTSKLDTQIKELKSKIGESNKDKNPILLLEEYEKNEKLALKEYQASQDEYSKLEKAKGSEEQSLRIFKEQIESIQNIQANDMAKTKAYFKQLESFNGKVPKNYPLFSESESILDAADKWINIPKTEPISNILPILETRLETTWAPLMERIKEVSIDLKTSVHTNKKRVEEYSEKLKDRASLEKDLAKSKKSLLVKNKLLEVFGKDEFRSYALGLLEKELVIGANQELNALCDGRYQLELRPGKAGAMDFYVLDQWRESILRKINTLSGGETFLVSLAMALALAELTRGQNEIDSFFIDEGFGHLDIDSIDEVLEVLMNIQNRGKQIGIISHVRALTDRIPVNLTLQKSTLGESRVEFSYN